MNEAKVTTRDLISVAAGIASAYVSKNPLHTSGLPHLINSTYATLVKLAASAVAESEKLIPAVPIKKSVTPDHIISLEDGKPYKSLKRHLNACGITPNEYRAKWGLPSNYPMVAPSYTAQRSEMARISGLGRNLRK